MLISGIRVKIGRGKIQLFCREPRVCVRGSWKLSWRADGSPGRSHDLDQDAFEETHASPRGCDFAFFRGPEHNGDTEARWAAILRAISETGVAVREKLTATMGNYCEASKLSMMERDTMLPWHWRSVPMTSLPLWFSIRDLQLEPSAPFRTAGLRFGRHLSRGSGWHPSCRVHLAAADYHTAAAQGNGRHSPLDASQPAS